VLLLGSATLDEQRQKQNDVHGKHGKEDLFETFAAMSLKVDR
jgi:hypothetical protein